MARKAAAVRGSKKGGQGVVVAVVLTGVAALGAMPLFLVAAAGMLPTAVAFLVDRHPRHYLACAVGALNLAGMVLPVLALTKAGFTLTGALQVLRDAQNWLIMYGAAAVGWIVNAAMPAVARIILDMRAEQENRRLLRQAEELVAEWGREISGR
jgi:hypothetical protein